MFATTSVQSSACSCFAAGAARPQIRSHAHISSGRSAVSPVRCMTKPTKAAEFRGFTKEQIDEEVAKSKRALFDLRFKQKTRQEYKSNDFGYHKTKVAQLLTVAREQELTEHPAGSSNRALRALEKKKKVAAGFPQF